MIWIHALMLYFFVRNTRLDKNIWIKLFALGALSICFSVETLLILPWYFQLLVVFIEIVIYVVYLIFYNNDVFFHQMTWFLPLTILFSCFHFIKVEEAYVVMMALLGFILTKHNKQKLSVKSYTLILVMIVLSLMMRPYYLVVLSVISLDVYQFFYDAKHTKDFNRLQSKMLTQQYDEIKHVYLNMRGWRHDYHNHIQAMKAYLSMGEFTELSTYLNNLEKSLNEVDHLVKSGHLMMDAILNSKITLMLKDHIHVDFKATLPEELKINDVDLCVIISNLLENAIEACQKIDVDKRFIRIYSEVYGSQFYLSIQNSAEEDLTFDQKHYISSKRGNHGLGMKRVAFLTKKYGGFLNLQNEPGIFASEVTIPL